MAEVTVTSTKVEAILAAAGEVIADTEGPSTPAQARLTLALHDYDPVRFNLGAKEDCPCGAQAECDECMTGDEALAFVRKLATRDQLGEIPAAPVEQG